MHICLIFIMYLSSIKMFNIKQSKRSVATMIAHQSPDPKYLCPYLLRVKFTRTVIRLRGNTRPSLRLTSSFFLFSEDMAQIWLKYDPPLRKRATQTVLTVKLPERIPNPLVRPQPMFCLVKFPLRPQTT